MQKEITLGIRDFTLPEAVSEINCVLHSENIDMKVDEDDHIATLGEGDGERCFLFMTKTDLDADVVDEKLRGTGVWIEEP